MIPSENQFPMESWQTKANFEYPDMDERGSMKDDPDPMRHVGKEDWDYAQGSQKRYMDGHARAAAGNPDKPNTKPGKYSARNGHKDKPWLDSMGISPK